ncbi:hypothetical protein ES288_D02G205000v1 [Gossypium darwinii]|nr:hypothetical protein ES288_D02G205000v1 [Gossypium darwinii]
MTKKEMGKPLIARISKQVDNINFLLEILLDRQMVEEFVDLWVNQENLLKLHERASLMVRYELSRVSVILFIAMGTRKLHCCSEARSGLLQAWFGPMLLDFGWLQRCKKGLDMKALEEAMGQTLLTLPLKQQYVLFMEWFRCFSRNGSECPNLSKAFQIWWRRSFLRGSETHAVESSLELWYTAILVLLAGYVKNATIAIDAFSICLNFNTWEFMICVGLFGAAIVRVANELGRGNAKPLKFAIKTIMSESICIGMVFFILCLGCWHQISYLFTSDELVAQVISSLSDLLVFSVLFNSFQAILTDLCLLSCEVKVGVPMVRNCAKRMKADNVYNAILVVQRALTAPAKAAIN